MCLHKKYTVQR